MNVLSSIIIVLSTISFSSFSHAGSEPDFKGPAPCNAGKSASYYNCQSVHLMGQLSLNNKGISATGGNDVWGWTDPLTGKEYAIMGMTSKTSFVDVTDPSNPILLGDLRTHTYNSTWRDMKVYGNYAFIVSEAYGHGLQVFDLSQLRNVPNAPVEFEETAFYGEFGSAHNIFINEDTGFAYVVGSNTCDNGMHMVNIQAPLSPEFVGCVDKSIFEDVDSKSTLKNKGDKKLGLLHGEDYTHDVHCVVYHGPDQNFQGREICVASNADTVNIVDVTDKSNPIQLSVSTYDGLGYTHQGWLTEDHKHFFLGDELDEQKHGVNTTTIWDLSDLTAPREKGRYVSSQKAIDHNMYVMGNYLYQSNYDAGLRILNIENVENAQIEEVGFFDIMPESNRATFTGAWSVFPYFRSGNVLISGINGRLYIVRPDL